MPSSRHFSFSDPLPYQAAIRAADIDLCVTKRGDFRAELIQIDLDRIWMQSGRESLPRVYHAAVNPKRAPIVFLADLSQPHTYHSGMEVRATDIICDGLGSTHHHRTRSPCHWRSMSLTPEDLAAAGYALAGREVTAPSVTCLVHPSRAIMSLLLSLHDTAEKLAKSSPEILAHPEVARSLEASLIYAMVMCLTESIPVEPDSGHRKHAMVIARFEEMMEASMDRPLYLTDICNATGVSERTLRLCCQEHLGMGPIRYLWLRRMHLTRRALILADSTMATVTEIATDHGFWELGRFATKYRALFGESPLASLRRPPDAQQILQGGPLKLPEIA